MHHINGDKLDNRLENLRLLSTSDHSPVLHVQEQQLAIVQKKLDEALEENQRLRDALLQSGPKVQRAPDNIIRRGMTNANQHSESVDHCS